MAKNAHEIRRFIEQESFDIKDELQKILMKQFIEQNKDSTDEAIKKAFAKINKDVNEKLDAPLSVSPKEQLTHINKVFRDNGLKKIFASQHCQLVSGFDYTQYNRRVEEAVQRLANTLDIIGVREKISDEQKEQIENLMKKYPFNEEFQKTLPVEQKLERLNTFLKKNGLAEIALLQSYYDYEEREKVLEQTMHQFEKKFSEIGVRESSKLSESQKGEVAAMTASFFGKKDGLKLLNSTPVSVLKYYFKEKIEQEQDFAVTTESVNSETIFNALEQNFQKLGDIPFSTAKQAEFFQKNGCNAAETYQAVKALKSQKSITDKISPTDILLPYPNNLLLELGITVSSQPVSAEFTSNLMQMIDETLKMQKTSLSELLEMRYEKNLPFEKIAKATKMPSVTASLPKKIQILKENKTFMQNAVEMYEAELNPEKVFSRKEEEIPSKPLPSKHTIAEQHFKSPVPKSDNPPVPEYPNNLLQAIGIDSEKPLSREFEKNLWEIIQKTNIPDRNMDILMQYYHDGRTQAELTKDFSISRERIRQIVLGTPRKIAKLKGTIIKNLYDKECMGELEYQRPDYPNNFLEAVGFGKINGKISEGFQSMLEDIMFNADNTRGKRANEILKDFYKHDFTKAEIAEKYDI